MKQVLLFVLQNNGQLHCINPITENLTKDILHLQNNALLDFGYVGSSDLMVSVGESGKGSLIQTRFNDISSPKSSKRNQFSRV